MGFFDNLGQAFKNAGQFVGGGGTVGLLYNKFHGNQPSQADADRDLLRQQANAASGFANQGQAGFTQLGNESAAARQMLMDQATGKSSLSAEQLRQGLQQNIATQRSMAASAAPANAAMAARTGAIQAGRLGAGMSGAAALAGIQERNQAAQLLNEQIARQRQLELEAATRSRGSAIDALSPSVQNPEKTWWEKYGPAAQAGLGMLTMSDRRLKTDVKNADDESRKVIDGLKAYSFKYKSDKHGKGKQLGIMAQDLESAGLGHAVVETREGKAVHGGKLATANTAMIAALGRRIAKLEGSSK